MLANKKHRIWKLTECKSNVSVKFYQFAITILKLVLHIKFYTFTAKYILCIYLPLKTSIFRKLIYYFLSLFVRIHVTVNFLR